MAIRGIDGGTGDQPIIEQNDASQISDGSSIQPGQTPASAPFAKDSISQGEAPDLFGLNSLPTVQNSQIQLSADQFTTDPNGKMVVANNELIGLLRGLLAQNPGESMSLNYARLPMESQAINGGIPAESQSLSGLPGGEVQQSEAISPSEAQSLSGLPGGEVQQSEAITPGEAQAYGGNLPGGEVQQSEAITPGEVNSFSGNLRISMTPELFDINSEGNLVVNNDQLADLFKSALNEPGGLVNFQATKTE